MSVDPIGPTTMDPPAGASVWQRDLFDHLASHVERERGLLGEYEAAARATSSKAFAYLVDLLDEDERRHHALFLALADTVKTESELSGVEPTVPRLDFGAVDPVAVRELTTRLLQSEEEDARELRRIHRQLRDVKDTTLWDLIIDLIRHDTEKHIAMLTFVLRHTPGARA